MTESPKLPKSQKSLRTFALSAFFVLSVPACAQNKTLGIKEVCFTRVNELGDLSLRCYDEAGNEFDRRDLTADKHTCFNPKEATKLSQFVDKCLKEGIKP
jgi:hypothetical protein